MHGGGKRKERDEEQDTANTTCPQCGLVAPAYALRQLGTCTSCAEGTPAAPVLDEAELEAVLGLFAEEAEEEEGGLCKDLAEEEEDEEGEEEEDSCIEDTNAAEEEEEEEERCRLQKQHHWRPGLLLYPKRLQHLP